MAESNSVAPSVNLDDVEDWLLKRLKAHGADVWTDGEFPNMHERLRHVIETQGYAHVIIGKHGGMPETYSQFWCRVFRESFEALCGPT